MKNFSLARYLVLFATLFAFVSDARAAFVVNVVPSPTRVNIGGTVNYSITVSNSAAIIQSVRVISQFPTDAVLLSAANNFSPGFVSTNFGQVTFSVDILSTSATANFTMQLQPASGGSFTNAITVQTLAGTEQTVSTNIVVNVAAPSTDLALAVSGVPPVLVVGDQFNVNMAVSNLGPSDAGGVNIQSTLPPGLSFVSTTPFIPSSFLNNQLLLTLGTLSNGLTTNFVVTLTAQASGDFSFNTSVVTTQNSDTSTSNNTATASLKSLTFATNNIAIASVSPMIFNPLTALLEQVVVVTNLTTNVINSVRVLATNLVAPNSLFNATGTNSGFPYIVLSSPLAPNGTAAASLQFFVTNRAAIDPGLLAVEGPSLVTLTVPTGTLVPTTISHLRTGGYSSVLLTFPTVVGRKYTLVAGDSIVSPLVTNLVTVTNIVTGTNGILSTNFTTATNISSSAVAFITNRVALYPPVVANSAHGEFIDAGPQVTGDGDRFYSVIEQP